MSKQILLIGGNSGIGAELKILLEDAGHSVHSITRSAGGPDLAQPDSVLPSIDFALNGLVYCPGSINLKPFGSLKLDDFRADMELNLFGLVRVLQKYLPALKAGAAESAASAVAAAGQASSEDGAVHSADSMSLPSSVVTFSTVAVGQGMPFHASVSAAKAAVEGLSRSLAAELAPAVRVNVIAPSLTDTPLATRLLRNDKQKEAAAARHPLKRYGSAAEVAATAAFLLSDQAAWISGQVLGVDGGMSRLRTS